MTDYLIVGAGLFGAASARMLADTGKSVLVIDRRNHIAGNCYDENYGGYYVNRYGGHIFHTNSKWIWNFVNRFTGFIQYEHRVKVNREGKVYSFPPNLMTFDQLGMKPSPEAEQKIREMFFEGYTAKQWGRPISEVPESVIKRIPFRYTYDDRYFSDTYQGIPEYGYTRMIERMLDSIPIELNTDFGDIGSDISKIAKRVIYSGSIDELFGNTHGRLEYRSLSFETETKMTDNYIGCATMNYADPEIPWTRIMEWKHFGWRKVESGETVVTYEYPRSHGDPYYPVETAENKELYKKYAQMASEYKWLKIGGRLGSYRYYNMDQVIGQALTLVKGLYD